MDVAKKPDPSIPGGASTNFTSLINIPDKKAPPFNAELSKLLN
jgi:hypothetical protein